MYQKQEPPFALVVVPPGERRRALLAHLESLKLTSKAVDSCRAVLECVQANPNIDIVITQVSLADGNWRDIISLLVSQGLTARIVVSSSVTDECFWSEALWRGVYDLLTEPYDRLEVRRIVDGALRAADHPVMQVRNAPVHGTPDSTAIRGFGPGRGERECLIRVP